MPEITGQESQIVIMENGDPEALIAVLPKIDSSRVIFVKNFEILPEKVRNDLLKRKSLVISGDLQGIVTKDDILKFSTRIFFSPFPGVDLPVLEKYQGFMLSFEKKGIVKVNNL